LEMAVDVHQCILDYFASRRLEINLDKSGSMLVTNQRPHALQWPADLPPRVMSYKYLGCIIDSKLLFRQWCDSIIKSIRLRVSLIKRLAVTKRLSRHQVETLYRAVVRGKLNYAASIWSRSQHAHRVLQAEISGQRVCFGALPRTPLVRIQRESRLADYESLILRADLRLFRAITTRPLLSSLRDSMDSFRDPLNDSFEHTTLYSIGHLPYLHGFLTDDFSERDILEKFPRPPLRPCRRSYRNEVILARFRMTVLPTRFWAHQQRLLRPENERSRIARCRHCSNRPEYISHLLFSCKALDYSMFPRDKFDHEYALSNALYGQSADETFQLENQVLLFVHSNNLFRFDHLTDSTNASKRRLPSISPARSQPAKKARRLRKRKKSDSDSEQRAPKGRHSKRQKPS
jgi:hypothetical protein